MAVPAINNTTPSAVAWQQGLEALRAFKAGRQKLLDYYRNLDAMRDNGAVTAYMAGKLGVADATEAGKAFDQIASLKGYVESEAPDTLGAATLLACANFGV